VSDDLGRPRKPAKVKSLIYYACKFDQRETARDLSDNGGGYVMGLAYARDMIQPVQP
jgi:hypothetical protein